MRDAKFHAQQALDYVEGIRKSITTAFSVRDSRLEIAEQCMDALVQLRVIEDELENTISVLSEGDEPDGGGEIRDLASALASRRAPQ